MIDGTTLALVRALAGSGGGGGITEEQVREIAELVTEEALTDYTTDQDVADAIAAALANYMTAAQTRQAIADAIAAIVDGDEEEYGPDDGTEFGGGGA